MRYINLMNKDSSVNFRTNFALKEEAEQVFRQLGLRPSEALNLFYKQVALRQGLPFDVKIPNAQTLQTFQETNEGKNLNHYKSVQDIFTKLS